MEGRKEERQERDNRILRRILGGEREAFGELVLLYQQDLFVKVFHWVRDRELAEEITQEVFLKAFKELANFRGEAKFSTWLFQIALNRCRDFWRVKKRHPQERIPLEGAPPLALPGNSAEDEMGREEGAQRVRRALAGLPQKYREALMMRFMGEMSCQEIAEATGQGLSNVKMRLLRGLEKLRIQLTEEDFR